MTEPDFVRAVIADPDDDTVRLAFAHPGFAGLREIHLNGLEADNLVDALAERPNLPVESIWVHHGHMGACSLTNAGLQKLANTPHWARLRDLDVGAVPMGYDWAE